LGPVPAEDVKRQARALDISDKVLRTAGVKLRITHTRKGFGPNSKVFWALADTAIHAQPDIEAHTEPPSKGPKVWAGMASMGTYDDVNADLDMDDVPFREAPVAQGAQGAQAFHAYTGHETLSALGLDEHLGKPPASVPVAPQHASAVTFTGTGGSGPTTRCDIAECYQPVTTASHHGQMLCFRHHPMGTSAPSLPMNIQRQAQ